MNSKQHKQKQQQHLKLHKQIPLKQGVPKSMAMIVNIETHIASIWILGPLPGPSKYVTAWPNTSKKSLRDHNYAYFWAPGN